MSKDLILKTSATINAPISKVWDALTDPTQIKKYLFGTEAKSDWKVGSPITFSGEWEGKAYVDKGTILEFVKEKTLKYNYWSNFAGEKDEPANYANITYSLAEENGKTIFTITQDNFKTKESMEHSEKNWGMVFSSIKEMLESE
jgi:uncharacterized protein YndB with AHSA1/START domain